MKIDLMGVGAPKLTLVYGNLIEEPKHLLNPSLTMAIDALGTSRLRGHRPATEPTLYAYVVSHNGWEQYPALNDLSTEEANCLRRDLTFAVDGHPMVDLVLKADTEYGSNIATFNLQRAGDMHSRRLSFEDRRATWVFDDRAACSVTYYELLWLYDLLQSLNLLYFPTE